MAEPASRLFFALWPEAPQREAIAAAAAGLLGMASGRQIPPERLHLTLLFLGPVPDRELPRLCAAAGRIRVPAFELKLDRSGHFGARVFYLGCRSVPPPLSALREGLELASAPLPFDRKPLTPHVTCARELAAPPPLDIAAIRWPVREFALVRSPEYHVVSQWPLQTVPAR